MYHQHSINSFIIYCMSGTQTIISLHPSQLPLSSTKIQGDHSLFDALCQKIQKQDKPIKSCSASTRSPDESDQEKSMYIAKTPKNINCRQTHIFAHQQDSSCGNSPFKFNIHTEEIDIIHEIKSQGKQHALQLNLKFQAITQNTKLQLNKGLDMSIFAKQFDKCYEMVQTLQATYFKIKTVISDLEIRKEDNFTFHQQFSETKLLEAYTKQILENCPVAKNLCDVIGVLLNTSLFQNQSQQTIESLLSIANLPRKCKLQQKRLIKSSILDYKEILRNINNLENVQHRVPIELSESFFEGLKRKHVKARKQK